jgi:hypothetical protein
MLRAVILALALTLPAQATSVKDSQQVFPCLGLPVLVKDKPGTVLVAFMEEKDVRVLVEMETGELAWHDLCTLKVDVKRRKAQAAVPMVGGAVRFRQSLSDR